jgi:HAD superfamily hydrolase (TIGR01490 family)
MPPTPGSVPTVAAFFDVDTVVADKTMLSFLRFHLASLGLGEPVFERKAAWLRRCAAIGMTQEEVNRAYFRLYAGVGTPDLVAQGRQWFAQQYARGGFFHGPALEAMRAHQQRGHAVVLVSGSFFPCLNPIAEHLRVNAVLGTEPVVRGGRLTGEVVEPLIGEAKARAVLAWATRHRINPARCYAYGDHITDLPLLKTVGHAVAVGDDRTLAEYVSHRGGERLPGVAPVPAGAR